MTAPARPGVAVVTGASAGIGAATVRALAGDGWEVVAGARRTERLAELVDEVDGAGGRARWLPLDVTDPASVDAFVTGVGECRVLVNNAGGAKGREAVADAVDEHWTWMFETNVLGLMRVTRGLLPAIVSSGDGHVVDVTSIAGIQAYPGGAGYNAAKFGAHAVTTALRHELLGQPVRVTEVLPGMVETEFSVVRFGGDEEAAAKVYEGLRPLSAADVAECIRWAVSLPGHVNVDQIVVKPRDQADAFRTHRRPADSA